MQVEVKALLDSEASYNAVLAILQQHFIRKDLQENHFFDTAAREFFAQGTILRLRLFALPDARKPDVFTKNYSSAKLMMKAHTHVEDGSQISWTAEEAIPVDTARCILALPRNLYSLLANAGVTSETILPRLEKEVPKNHLEALEYVGNFTTLRSVFHFKSEAQTGLVLHVDHTMYPFGDHFEVEIPNITVPVQDVAAELSAFLNANGIRHEFATESKFQRFARELLAEKSKSHMVQDVKVVLDNADGAQRVSENLQPYLLSEQLQENHFYDGFDDELAARGAFFRIRHEVHGNRFVAVLKEHQDVDSGSQVNWTQEVDLAPEVAAGILRDPSAFLSLSAANNLAQSLKDKFGLGRLRSIGGFSTVRRVYAWENASSQPQGGLQLRVDSTTFPFGEHYEVEVTNIAVPVGDVLSELEAVLRSLGVAFHVATESKLDCFLRGCSRQY